MSIDCLGYITNQKPNHFCQLLVNVRLGIFKNKEINKQ